MMHGQKNIKSHVRIRDGAASGIQKHVYTRNSGDVVMTSEVQGADGTIM
jgi:hypothetical protein